MNDELQNLILRSNEIDFNEQYHEYKHPQKKHIQFTSGTTAIKDFHDHFDAEKISTTLAKGDEIKKAELLRDWSCSGPKGTYIHRLAELYCMDLMGEYDFPAGYDNVQFRVIADYVDSLLLSGWKILRPELIIWDEELQISGMADLVLYNSKNEVSIVDYKTCKRIEIVAYNNKTMKGALSHLPDTKFNHYALQLSLYQYMLEKNSPVKIVQRVLIQSSEDGNKALIPVPYLRDEVEIILSQRGKDK